MKVARPWYREQTASWYVQLGGRQHPLGKHPAHLPPPRKEGGEWRPPKEVAAAWHRLMAGEGLSKPVKDLPLAGLVEQFLVDSAKDCTPKRVKDYGAFLADFVKRFPRLRPEDIAPRHVRSWLHAERRREWKQNTQRSAITVLKRLLNWARKNRLISANPIADLERPAAVARERVLEESERERILAWYPEGDVFRDLLIALTESGCRPGEAIRVTAKDIDFSTSIIRKLREKREHLRKSAEQAIKKGDER